MIYLLLWNQSQSTILNLFLSDSDDQAYSLVHKRLGCQANLCLILPCFLVDSSGVVALPLENIATKKTPTADTPSDKKKFDPLGGVISFAHRPVRFAANRFDFLENVLNGGWQEENQTLENLPRWDPISAVHKAAGILALNIWYITYAHIMQFKYINDTNINLEV